MTDDGDSESRSGSSPGTPRSSCWDHLRSTLDSIESIGDYATMKRYQLAANPVIQIGDQLIPLPLTDRDAESIKKLAHQAPFGRGDQTVVDVTVRRTWELSFDDFRLTNPAWPSFLDTVLQEACDKMGIIGSVDAQPHKLLLYERDSFFRPHKDSQKEVGMIGTLAICLPAKHEGGEVHLSHAGKKHTFSTSKHSPFDITALAWFSDVTHEVRKVASGHRLVLTYNIIHQSGLELSAAAFNEQTDTVNDALTQCSLQDPSFTRKIYVLGHKYSRAGLSLRTLKGRDRAVCQSLYTLCSRHGFCLLLSHITREVSRDPDLYNNGDDDADEIALYFGLINRPDGAEIAHDITFHEEELLHDPYVYHRDEDSFEESEDLGNQPSPEIFKYYDTAAIICRKTHLGSFLNFNCERNINVSNMMMMVMQDHKENPDTTGALDDSLVVLEKMVEWSSVMKPPSICVEILKWAWENKYENLYRKSVVSSIYKERGREGMRAVANIINTDVSDARDEADLQWDQYLGSAIADVHDLTRLARSLAVVGDAIVDSLKPAFTKWKREKEQNKFESKKCLDLQDEDFIKSRLHDSDWVTNCLVPALSERGAKSLITSLVRELPKDLPDATQIKPRDIAAGILQSTYLKVALDSTDFKVSYGGFPSTQASSFIRLVERSLELGLESMAIKILEASWTNIKACHKEEKSVPLMQYKAMVECFLHHLVRLLREHRVPHVDSTRQLFTLLIRRYLHSTAPSYPKNPVGWSFKPRGCGCIRCKEFDDFLREDVKDREISVDEYYGRYHIESYFSHILVNRADDESKGTVKVSKVQSKEFELNLNEYKKEVAKFEKPFEDLRHEYLKELLGDVNYRELVMLEGVKESEGSKQLASAIDTAGTKRAFDDETSESQPPANKKRS
ncbi:hypothetical protein F5Y03DRAFT_350483 [Xylaria venustula]|nr:hypothetical protein F5Y03DRAFT_350483 [Xylaria venustula]